MIYEKFEILGTIKLIKNYKKWDVSKENEKKR